MTAYVEGPNRYNKVQILKNTQQQVLMKPVFQHEYPYTENYRTIDILEPHRLCEKLAALYCAYNVINFEYPDKNYIRNWDIEIDNFDDLMRKTRAFLREHFLKKEGE